MVLEKPGEFSFVVSLVITRINEFINYCALNGNVSVVITRTALISLIPLYYG